MLISCIYLYSYICNSQIINEKIIKLPSLHEQLWNLVASTTIQNSEQIMCWYSEVPFWLELMILYCSNTLCLLVSASAPCFLGSVKDGKQECLASKNAQDQDPHLERISHFSFSIINSLDFQYHYFRVTKTEDPLYTIPQLWDCKKTGQFMFSSFYSSVSFLLSISYLISLILFLVNLYNQIFVIHG